MQVKRVFLIGYMGAGKTTAGKILARRMNLNYIDTDYFVESRYHRKISEIFASEGEAYFREMEQRILLELSEYEDVIVSTGGGLPCFNGNMTLMNNTGITVYLDVPAAELAARLEKSITIRPVLKQRAGDELIGFIKESLSARKPFYEQAKIWLQTEKMNNNIEVLVEELESLLNQYYLL